jgi:beta-phosphoglucomutase
MTFAQSAANTQPGRKDGMIQAVLFDLDGTLVQTEKLKARSYAKAVIELCPDTVDEAIVLEAFKEVVGRPRREVARSLMERFGLEEQARTRMQEFGVETPWQAFVQVRLGYYKAMLADSQVLVEHQWPHNLSLLREARLARCKVGLATMSHCPQAQRVLKALQLTAAFDFVATRDDVENGKPDPEIYLLVARELQVAPRNCLVIEDSPAGVQAALAAGMWCIAVSTPFTRNALRAGQLLDERWIVDDPASLPDVVGQMLLERSGITDSSDASER